jgi:hypothetical protein
VKLRTSPGRTQPEFVQVTGGPSNGSAGQANKKLRTPPVRQVLKRVSVGSGRGGEIQVGGRRFLVGLEALRELDNWVAISIYHPTTV